MRDTLPNSGPKLHECAIVNLDSNKGVGTHWVAFKKTRDVTHYYNSYGDLQQPIEITKYLYTGATPTKTIMYNYKREQSFNSVICGHLCLKFLSNK